ncbi:MAG: hypothetical protein COS92_05425 [Desulfobacterales bacterium CG07_land_8_20_14_0_80_52_14]|nr:MAG: hypothetical protein COS92_05425 [Desulfobacterales bacterium CG07_land_8_20_14_0_80_52_14]
MNGLFDLEFFRFKHYYSVKSKKTSMTTHLKGGDVMKSKWTLVIIFLLAISVGGTPVFADIYGHRDYRHPHYPRYHHYHPHYYRGGDVFLGALFGFTLGAILTPPPPPPPVYVYQDYPPTVVYRDRYVYVPAPSQIYREPITSSSVQAATDSSCLQTREYTTTIIIEGKEVQAYGTKCLRPDGSWSYGPAQPVPTE